MRVSKIPPKIELLPFVKDRKMAAEKYGVTQKTISRWMQEYGLYQPKNNFGCNKLNMDKARDIRDLRKNGKSLKEIASVYGVTVSTISRIVHNIVYRDEKEVADVKVIYNPDPSTSATIAVFNNPD
jgi:uncharacterized protein YjcR